MCRSFICFDIVFFYPSIIEELLLNYNALNFQLDEEKHIVIQVKKRVLFNRNQVWCKNESDSLFDVTMGSFGGASWLISSIQASSRVSKWNWSLQSWWAYSIWHKTKRNRNIKKQICSALNERNLKTTIEANKKYFLIT